MTASTRYFELDLSAKIALFYPKSVIFGLKTVVFGLDSGEIGSNSRVLTGRFVLLSYGVTIS